MSEHIKLWVGENNLIHYYAWKNWRNYEAWETTKCKLLPREGTTSFKYLEVICIFIFHLAETDTFFNFLKLIYYWTFSFNLLLKKCIKLLKYIFLLSISINHQSLHQDLYLMGIFLRHSQVQSVAMRLLMHNVKSS